MTLTFSPNPFSTALVTGGTGFLGRALVRQLCAHGVRVRVFDLTPHPDPTVESMVGDLRDPSAVKQACSGMDVVFHTASLIDWSLGKRATLWNINVQGTQHILEACWAAGVSRLVYTSSIDTLFVGNPIAGGDETLPYPSRYLNDYGLTKAEAERRVLAAHGQRNLLTCAIRLGGLYGPDEKFRLVSLYRLVKQGKPLPGLGDGRARFNHLFVDNAAHGHWLAARALQPGHPAGGQAFFILDSPPRNYFHFHVELFEHMGLQPRIRWIPEALLLPLGWLVENLHALGLIRAARAPLSRYVVTSTTRDCWFQTDKAQRLLGYQPLVSPEEALTLTAHWLHTVD